MKILVLDSSKGSIIENINDNKLINLNALIDKDFNKDYIRYLLEEVKDIDKISIGNLASLCYKLNIKYDAKSTLNMVREVISIIRDINPSINLIFDHVYNYLEDGIRPYKDLYKIEGDILYIVKPLMDVLNLLGFSKVQIINLFEQNSNFIDFLPRDLKDRIPTKYNTYMRLTERYFI